MIIQKEYSLESSWILGERASPFWKALPVGELFPQPLLQVFLRALSFTHNPPQPLHIMTYSAHGHQSFLNFTLLDQTLFGFQG